MDPEVHAFAFLQVRDNVKEVPGLRIAFRTKHLAQAFRVLPGQRAECLKAMCPPSFPR
jgi:hypothetical protein